ncbi:MAG: AarF/ABC1/UbiB kinase family protein [Firmicutes bacterium]|nr:AarF/ABC1/UbiB kinase family protein [Bacillota bacterium]
MFDFFKVTNIYRGKEIVTILIRYGFQDLLDKLSIDTSMISKKVNKTEAGLSLPVKVRKILEELGPTFIKFGQIASMRTDLLPQEYLQELQKLQDHVPAESTDEVIKIVEYDLGQPISEVYEKFSEEPIAAGSISQVHKAKLRETGQNVAVKVRRPNIEDIIKNDLSIIEWFADKLHNTFEDIKSFDLPALSRELKRTILRELDFKREARNMIRFGQEISGNDRITVPKVYSGHSTNRVLTMEMIEGEKPYNYHGHVEIRQQMAEAALKIYVEMVFEQGFFHADPHAGNILITKNNRLCILDWGMTGRLTKTMQFRLLSLMAAVLENNEERVVRLSLSTFGRGDNRSRELLTRDVMELLDDFNSSGGQNIGTFLMKLINLYRSYEINVPAQFVFMSRAMLAVEGLSRQLYPQINVIEVVKPQLKNNLKKFISPLSSENYFKEEVKNLVWESYGLPDKINNILDMAARGELKFEHKGLYPLKKALLDASNKLALALITGSLIVGSSLVITSNTPPLIFGHSAIGAIGYLFSSVLGMYLVVSILRGKR